MGYKHHKAEDTLAAEGEWKHHCPGAAAQARFCAAHRSIRTINRTREGIMSDHTLTKADIIEEIYAYSGRNRSEVKQQVEDLLSLMKDSIKKDYSLLISGFGKFEAYDKKARKGRNPQTEESITLPPRTVCVFRLSRKFRSELNQQ
jgi:integration host factor subunit alpha